jgi:type IV pilus assembly protein PilB
VLSAERLQQVLEVQQSEGGKRRLGRMLVDQGIVDETQLTQVLGRQLSVPWVSLYHVDFSRQLLNLVPREVAEGYGLVPVYVRHVRGQGETLYVATDDPTNEEGLRRASAYAGLPVRAMIASASDIRAAIRVYYGGGPAAANAPVKVEHVALGQGQAPRAAAEGRPKLPPGPPPAPSQKVPTVPQPSSRVPTTPLPGEGRANEGRANEGRANEGRANEGAPSGTAPNRTGGRVPQPSSAPKTAPQADGPPPAPRPANYDDAPEIEAHSIPIPPRKKGRAIALTFLDGTTISLPAPRTGRLARRDDDEPPTSEEGDEQLTARDLVAALRAVAHGAEAKEILGDNPRWEAMFAALLSLLLKKHLIADWEFVEEFRKL